MSYLIAKFKHPAELLNHILDQPDLPAIIKRLDTVVLTKLINHVGLEDSAEILSLATADQLKGVLDVDLWKSKSPGKAEAFDADRFGLWLEIMLESGAGFAAKKVMELDEDLVTLGLCRLVLAVKTDELVLSDARQSAHDPMMDRVLDNNLNQQFDNYLVFAKNDSYWEAVQALLLELNELDYGLLTRLLERCSRISWDYMEDNGGFFKVFSAEEILEEDVADERKARQEAKGFVTPTSAGMFLASSRTTATNKILAAKTFDPSTRAYFATAETDFNDTVKDQAKTEPPEKEASEELDIKVAVFIQTLQNAEILPTADHKLLDYDGTESWDFHLPLTEAMDFISRTDSALYSQLMAELSYLSNTLISGCGFKGRTFKPRESAQAAFSVCNLGCDYLLEKGYATEENQPNNPILVLLGKYHLIKLFQVGWKILFDNVVHYTAKAVLGFIDHHKYDMRDRDPDQVYEMTYMASLLRSHIATHRPWEFNDKLDYLELYLDGKIPLILMELLQECPTLPEIICKKGGHQPSPFIWSLGHIRTIRRYLSGVLSPNAA